MKTHLSFSGYVSLFIFAGFSNSHADPASLPVNSSTPLADGGSCALAAIFNPLSDLPTFQDFEIAIDPEDPEQNLIFTSNVEHGAPEGTDIFVMQLDGRTGMLSAGPRIIAKNFTGRAKVNGPELAFIPGSGLGVLFAGPHGVHGAWREEQAGWNAFLADVDGQSFAALEPPGLPASVPGRHPDQSQPFGLQFYSEIDFLTDTCSEACYAYPRDAVTTDLGLALATSRRFNFIRSSPNPLAEGYTFVFGCSRPYSDPSDCGVFEVKIDGFGGIEPATFTQLSELSWYPRKKYRAIRYNGISATIHPLTERLVVVLLYGRKLTVWEADAPHSPLRLVGENLSLPTGKRSPHHLRLIAGATNLYLEFYLRDGPEMGAWLLTLDDSLGPPVRIDERDPTGSEVVYLPAVNRLAYYDRVEVTIFDGITVDALERCWIDL